MSREKTPKIKPALLRAAFKTDLAACWQHARSLHPDHQAYAFVLYGLEGGAYLTPHVLTEESLTEVATRYLKEGYHDTLDESRKALRYSVADSPLFAELEDMLPSVEALLKPHEQFLTDEETAAYKLLAKAAMEALKALDAEVFFGKGKQRERLLLVILTEDTEEDWTKRSARQLNPPAVFRRYEADTKIEGNYACSEAIAIAPDGRSLYSTGSRQINPKKELDTSEVVAYEIAGPKLKRRWELLFSMFGDSGRAISCSRDGKTIVVMRAKYADQTGLAWLMRFGRDKNTVIDQAQIQGEPCRFAVSKDDSRMAVSMHDRSLHIVDGKFSVLKILKLPVKARDLKFLDSGDLLAATETGILRITSDFKSTATPFKDKCLQVSVDAGEKLAVATLDYTVLISRSLEHETELGCKLLRLPSLEPIRELKLPGLIVENAIISPDGRYVACDVKRVGTYRHFIVVCETATGKEIARQKANSSTNDLKFLSDNRTLVIAKSGFIATEPVNFWCVPGL